MELLELRIIVSEMKNILARINNRLDTAGEKITIRRHGNQNYPKGNRKGNKPEKTEHGISGL